MRGINRGRLDGVECFWNSARWGGCMCGQSLQLCPTLGDLIDCSLPGSFVHRILQARILEWVSIPSSSASSSLRDRTSVSCIASRFFNAKPPENPRWWERRFKRNCTRKHNNIRHFVRKVTVIQDYFWFGWRRNGTIQKHFWSEKKVSDRNDVFPSSYTDCAYLSCLPFGLLHFCLCYLWDSKTSSSSSFIYLIWRRGWSTST